MAQFFINPTVEDSEVHSDAVKLQKSDKGKTTQIKQDLNLNYHMNLNCKLFMKSQLCMCGCSNKAWLKKGGMQGILHMKRGFSKCFTQSIKIFE